MNDLSGVEELERLREHSATETTCSTKNNTNQTTDSGVGVGRRSTAERSPRGQYSMSV